VRRLHAFLLERGEPVAPIEIRDAFGWYGSKATDRLKLLARAGLAERTSGGTHTSRWVGRNNAPPPDSWNGEGAAA
jgi:hypothetical protein